MGAAVRDRREARGWSPQQLADASGVGRTTINKLEEGYLPTTANLRAVAGALETTVGALLNETAVSEDIETVLPGWSALSPDRRSAIRMIVSGEPVAVAEGRRPRAAEDSSDYEVDLGGLTDVQLEIVRGIPLSQRAVVAAAFRAEYARQHEDEVGRGRPPREHLTPRTTRPRVG